MNLGHAIEGLHQAEIALAEACRKAADRHAVEHDVYHLCHSLERQCRSHAEHLGGFAGRYGAKVSGPESQPPWENVVGMVRRKGSELLGRSPKTGALLLRDLVSLYRSACETEIGWWMVRQGALAARDAELAQLFESCHEETWNQLKWLKTKIKEASPQALVVG